MPDTYRSAPVSTDAPSPSAPDLDRARERVEEYLLALRQYYLTDGITQPEGRSMASMLRDGVVFSPLREISMDIANERMVDAANTFEMPAPERFDEAIERACQTAGVADVEAVRPYLRSILQRAVIHALACDLDDRGQSDRAQSMRALMVETFAALPTRDRVAAAL